MSEDLNPFNYQSPDVDVIIIGAGVTGMTAAYTLLEKEPSLDIIIIEASDKIGGRTLTPPLLTASGEQQAFDIGGQWISSQQTNLLQLLGKLGIKTEAPEAEGEIVIECNGRSYKQKKDQNFKFCNAIEQFELSSFEQKIMKLGSGESLPQNLLSMNMEQFINGTVMSATVKTIFKFIILVHFGVEACNLSVAFYVFYSLSVGGISNQMIVPGRGLHEFWIKNGAQEICNKIAENVFSSGVHFFFNEPVIAITETFRHVSVKTNKGAHCAYNVIITVPFAEILKIDFTPQLPKRKTQILENSLSGDLFKFVATFKECFWKKRQLSGDILVLDRHSTQRPILCCFNVSTSNNPALSGLLVEDSPREVVLKQLSTYFGQEAMEALDFVVKTWTRGSPTCLKSFEDLAEIKQDYGRLFWGGSETSLEWYGSIAGAVSSGLLIAFEVLYDLRPGLLTRSNFEISSLNLRTMRSRVQTRDNMYHKLLSNWKIGLVIGLVSLYAFQRLVRRGILPYFKN